MGLFVSVDMFKGVCTLSALRAHTPLHLSLQQGVMQYHHTGVDNTEDVLNMVINMIGGT